MDIGIVILRLSGFGVGVEEALVVLDGADLRRGLREGRSRRRASFAAARVGRSVAYADIYNNGRLDVLLSTNGGSVHLFRNEAIGAPNYSLRIKLVGTKSNRDGIGAAVRITTPDGAQTQMLRSGSSYLSASELVLTFGLGQHDKVEAMEVRWPSGQVDRLSNVAAEAAISVTEGKGITSTRSYGK